MKNNSIRIFFFLLLSLWSQALAGQDFSELVKQSQGANDEEVLRLAQKMENENELSFGLYYNQGLAYQNLGQQARARASYEKAALFEPRNLELRRRLNEVKARMSPQLAEKDVLDTPLWTAIEAQVVLFLPTLLLLLAGVLNLAGKPFKRKVILVLSSLFTAVLVIVVLQNPAPHRAVVVSNGAKILNTPSPDGTGPVLLNGLLVNVIERKSHFFRIETRDGSAGWVRNAEVVELETYR